MMNDDDIPETDQWKLDGDCNKCRKKDYCGKECRAAKIAFQKYMKELVDGMIKNAAENKDDE